MDKQTIESTANDAILEGIDARKRGDIDSSRNFFAIAWGLNRVISRSSYCNLAFKLLKSANLTEEGAKRYREKGYDAAQRTISLLEAIEENL